MYNLALITNKTPSNYNVPGFPIWHRHKQRSTAGFHQLPVGLPGWGKSPQGQNGEKWLLLLDGHRTDGRGWFSECQNWPGY